MRVRLAMLSIAFLVAAGCGSAPVKRTSRPPMTPRKTVPSMVPANRAGASEASKRCRDLLDAIRTAAEEQQLDPALLVGVVRVESNFRNDARSTAGAIGLTQVLRSTARAKKCGDLGDVAENLRCGARVLNAFLGYYKGNLYHGLSGYNAGHAMPNQARKSKALPVNVEYVENVLSARARFLQRGCDF